MKRIRVPDNVNGEYAGERISLKSGAYVASPVRVGHALPGRNIVQNPVVSYILKDEGARQDTQRIAAEAFQELRRLGLIIVKE